MNLAVMGLAWRDADMFNKPDVTRTSAVRGSQMWKHQKLVAPGLKPSDSSRMSELASRLASVRANGRNKTPLLCLCSGINDTAEAEVAVGGVGGRRLGQADSGAAAVAPAGGWGPGLACLPATLAVLA